MSLVLADDLAYVLRATDADDSRSADLSDLLVQSAGLINGSTVYYRKYFVAALELWLRTENNLKAGEGAIFDQNNETTRRYLTMQGLEDEAYKIAVSVYTVDSLLFKINADKSGQSSIISF